MFLTESFKVSGFQSARPENPETLKPCNFETS
jgi:hypothetical protein